MDDDWSHVRRGLDYAYKSLLPQLLHAQLCCKRRLCPACLLPHLRQTSWVPLRSAWPLPTCQTCVCVQRHQQEACLVHVGSGSAAVCAVSCPCSHASAAAAMQAHPQEHGQREVLLR